LWEVTGHPTKVITLLFAEDFFNEEVHLSPNSSSPRDSAGRQFKQMVNQQYATAAANVVTVKVSTKYLVAFLVQNSF